MTGPTPGRYTRAPCPPRRPRASSCSSPGSGTNLQALLDACADPAYGATVVAVGADRDGIEGLARAERAGVPTFVRRVERLRRPREHWDARADRRRWPRYEPDLVVLGRLHEAGRRGVPRRASAAASSTPTRRCCPSFPGMHGPADALAYGVKVTGCTLFVVDAGVDTGPIVAQARGAGVEDDDTVESLHERIKVAERAMLRRRASAGWPATGWSPIDRQEGRGSAMSSTADLTSGRIPIRRALVSVYDKTGLEDLVRGLHDAGVALVSTGGSAAPIEALGLPVTKVEDLTGFPECLDGRVKTLHPQVHAGILADRRLDVPRAAARRARRRAVRPGGLQPLPVHARPSPPAPTPDECVEQIDIGGPSMVRAAAKNHPSVAIVTSPGALRRRAGRAWPPAASRWPQRQRAGRRGVRAHRDVRRRGGVLDGQRAHRHLRAAPASRPGSGAHLGQGGGAALRREPAPAGRALHQRLRRRPGWRRPTQLHGKEMSYNNYVDADAARRAAYDFDRAGGRDHQARQPVRHRGRRRRRRGAPQGARLRPGVGVRRRDRDQRAGDGRDGRAGRRDLHRGRRRAGYEDGAVEILAAQEEHPAAASAAPLPARRRRDRGRSPAGC